MKRSILRIASRVGLAVFIFLTLALTGIGHAAADDAGGAGWYGPYSDGCSYYWDGAQWTGDADCAATSATVATSGYAAGWYDAYGDGCLYYYDGTQYTGDTTCTATSATSSASGYAAGWYDAHGDGCLYYYDGTQYTGATTCTAASATSSGSGYAAGWYDAHGDGCLYYYDGTQYTGATSCVVNGITILTPAESGAASSATTTVSTTGGSADSVFPTDTNITAGDTSGGCGDFCQPDFGRILEGQLSQHPVSADKAAEILGGPYGTLHTAGCAYVVEGYCYP